MTDKLISNVSAFWLKFPYISSSIKAKRIALPAESKKLCTRKRNWSLKGARFLEKVFDISVVFFCFSYASRIPEPAPYRAHARPSVLTSSILDHQR